MNDGVPRGSVLGPPLLLVDINDRTDNISSKKRLFADDSSLFTCVNGIQKKKVGEDLEKVTNWAYQRKMILNPVISKQAVEIIFSFRNNLSTLNSYLVVYR